MTRRDCIGALAVVCATATALMVCCAVCLWVDAYGQAPAPIHHVTCSPTVSDSLLTQPWFPDWPYHRFADGSYLGLVIAYDERNRPVGILIDHINTLPAAVTDFRRL